jgi:16S rRNA (guanine966-N2)-methyltransferase
MRVIAGSARRLLLKTPPGDDTRPTTDRIKETLFNMIQFDIPGSSFLDLFAGSGGIAIEALSRGALHATLADINPKAVACIKENLIHTGFSDNADVYTGDAVQIVKRIAGIRKKAYDIVFLDPPYGQGLEDRALSCMKGTGLLNSDSIIIVEMDIDADTDHFRENGYSIERIKEYKTNKHVFLKLKSTDLV